MTGSLQRTHDVRTSDFALVVHDCETGPDFRPTMTEIFGFFRLPGENDNAPLTTDSLVVPIDSPIAQMAHQISRNRAFIHRLAAILLRAVQRCECAGGVCSAMDELSLVEAIEHTLTGGCP